METFVMAFLACAAFWLVRVIFLVWIDMAMNRFVLRWMDRKKPKNPTSEAFEWHITHADLSGLWKAKAEAEKDQPPEEPGAPVAAPAR